MANADQLSKQLLESMEIIGKNIVNGLEYDKTIKAVVQESNSTSYLCKYNDITFTAVGPEGEYVVGDNVWVNIPQSNWKNQKTIISRSETDENPNRVVLPFSNLVSVNNNQAFYESSGEYHILANGETQEVLIDSITNLYSSYNEPFDLLGLKVQFNTGKLTPFNVTEGNYGIRLKLYNSANENYATYEFDCSSMMGNLYAFNDYIEQQMVFDISEVRPAQGDTIKVYLIQKNDFAGYHGSSQLSLLQYGADDDTSDNIYARAIKLFLGYNKNNIKINEGDLVLIDGDYLYYEGWGELGRNTKRFTSVIWKTDSGGTLYRETNISSLVWSFGNDKNWEVIPNNNISIKDNIATVILPQDRLKEDTICFRAGKSVVTLVRYKAPMYSIEYDMEHAIRLSYEFRDETDGVYYGGPDCRLRTLEEAFCPHYVRLNWEPLSNEIANNDNFLAGATITWEGPGFNNNPLNPADDFKFNKKTIFMEMSDGREYNSDYDEYSVNADRTRISYTFGNNFSYKNDVSAYMDVAKTKGAFSNAQGIALKVRDVNHCLYKFRAKQQYISSMTNNTVTCTIKKGVYTFKGSFEVPIIKEKTTHNTIGIVQKTFEPLCIMNQNENNVLELVTFKDEYTGNVNWSSSSLYLMRYGEWGYVDYVDDVVYPNGDTNKRGHLYICKTDYSASNYVSYYTPTSDIFHPQLHAFGIEDVCKDFRFIFSVILSEEIKVFYFDYATRVSGEYSTATISGMTFKYCCYTYGEANAGDIDAKMARFTGLSGSSDADYFAAAMTLMTANDLSVIKRTDPDTPFFINYYTPITFNQGVLTVPFTSLNNSHIDDNLRFLAIKAKNTSGEEVVHNIPIVYHLKYFENAYTPEMSYFVDTHALLMPHFSDKIYINSEGEHIGDAQTDRDGNILYPGRLYRGYPFGKSNFNTCNWNDDLSTGSRYIYAYYQKSSASQIFDSTILSFSGFVYDYAISPDKMINCGAAPNYSTFGDNGGIGFIETDCFISPAYTYAWGETSDFYTSSGLYPSISEYATIGVGYWGDYRDSSYATHNYSLPFTLAVQYKTSWSDDFNRWDGNKVQINDDSVFARSMAAGTKKNGKFTGVILGDVHNVDSTVTAYGLYGYHESQQSFGFMSNGKAFIGKKGRGRLEFDGNRGTISSTLYNNTASGHKKGMLIDFDDGKIDICNESGDTQYFMRIDVSDTNLNLNNYPLKIGTDDDPKFKVNWKGEIYCSDAIINGARLNDIVQASIANGATVNNNGTISGGTIENVTITGDNTDLHLANLRIRRTGVEFSSGYLDINSGCSFRFHSENMDKYQINFVSAINSDGTYTVGTMFVIGTEPAYNTHVLPFPYLKSISQTTSTGSPLATITDGNGGSTVIYRGDIDFTRCDKYNNH